MEGVFERHLMNYCITASTMKSVNTQILINRTIGLTKFTFAIRNYKMTKYVK